MSARDELAGTLLEANLQTSYAEAMYDHEAEHYADAILAAGYSKPRTIPNEHLSQFSDGSYPVDHKAGTIVKSADGSVWRFDEGDWDCLDWASASLRGPATVLYTPEVSK